MLKWLGVNVRAALAAKIQGMVAKQFYEHSFFLIGMSTSNTYVAKAYQKSPKWQQISTSGYTASKPEEGGWVRPGSKDCSAQWNKATTMFR